MKNAKLKKGGFTLIELLVVIAIIGLLSSIVLASLGTARNKARDAATKVQLSEARAQAELYAQANGGFYFSVCSTAASFNGFGNTTGPGLMKAIADSSGGTAQMSETAGGPPTLLGGIDKVTCHTTLTTWVMDAPLRVPSAGMIMWCVDSKGASKAEATFMADGATSCV